MTIWVDADGCPERVRRIVEKAAIRLDVPAVFVANRPLPIQDSPLLAAVVVDSAAGAADEYIRGACAGGDLAVTADIPLAADLVGRGLDVIHPRGDFLTRETVGERLSMRDFVSSLRDLGLDTRGRAYHGGTHRFAAVLDRELARRRRPG